jgi:hypothetical protein
MGILNETIGGVPIGTLLIGMAIVLTIVWFWSRWDERKARKRATKRAEYRTSIEDHTRARTRVMEEAKKVLQETRLPNTSTNDDRASSTLVNMILSEHSQSYSNVRQQWMQRGLLHSHNLVRQGSTRRSSLATFSFGVAVR